VDVVAGEVRQRRREEDPADAHGADEGADHEGRQREQGDGGDAQRGLLAGAGRPGPTPGGGLPVMQSKRDATVRSPTRSAAGGGGGRHDGVSNRRVFACPPRAPAYGRRFIA
jgi:hypothetical protein